MKFIFVFFMVFFSLHSKADCSMEQNKSLSKLLKLNGVEVISIGGLFDNSGACTFVVSSAQGYGKLHSSYIYNGEDRYTKMLKHGLETYYSTYDTKNQIKNYERHYVYGKIDGLETTFHANGKIASEKMFRNDLPNGINTMWNEDGVKISEKLYRDGAVIKASEINVADKKSLENSQIEIAKQKCIKLGFKEKTEKFGVCVLEFIN